MFICEANVSVHLFGLLVILGFTSCVSSDTPDCTLVNKDSAAEKALLGGLHDLRGETFSVEEKVDGKVRTIYEIGVCASPNKSMPQAGALQHSIGEKENKTTVLGYFNATSLTGSHGPGAWTLLTYKNGDKFINSTCGNLSREAQLMVVCDSTVHHGVLQIANSKTNCSYLFVLGSNVVCSKDKPQQPPHGLSGGSVFCILFFTVLGSYLLLGFMYKRIVMGAKGLEQIPNYSFWKDFGSLQADGCNYLCRCQCDGASDHRAYRDIDDRPPRADEDRDDQLLTM
ncbi:unnamed protein product [Ixodes hexagonus]